MKIDKLEIPVGTMEFEVTGEGNFYVAIITTFGMETTKIWSESGDSKESALVKVLSSYTDSVIEGFQKIW